MDTGVQEASISFMNSVVYITSIMTTPESSEDIISMIVEICTANMGMARGVYMATLGAMPGCSLQCFFDTIRGVYLYIRYYEHHDQYLYSHYYEHEYMGLYSQCYGHHQRVYISIIIIIITGGCTATMMGMARGV